MKSRWLLPVSSLLFLFVPLAPSNSSESEGTKEGVIAEMLKSDRKFRAEYAIDPVEACKAHGFAFTAEDASVSAQLAATAELPIASWDRPS